jgi:hypothetical protein
LRSIFASHRIAPKRTKFEYKVTPVVTPEFALLPGGLSVRRIIRSKLSADLKVTLKMMLPALKTDTKTGTRFSRSDAHFNDVPS